MIMEDIEKQQTEKQDFDAHEEEIPLYEIRDPTPQKIASPLSSPTPIDTAASDKVDPTKTFFIALGVFVLLLIAIFLIPRFFSEGPETLSDIHKENLEQGKDSDTEYVYNGYSFVHYDGLWYTQILNGVTGDLYDIPLHYGPKNLTDIVITGDLDPFFSRVINGNISNASLRYYLTFDPNSSDMGYIALASGELTQNLVKTFNIAPVPACTEENEQCAAVPIISCETTQEPVIFMKFGSPTLVYADGNCITIQGEGIELVRAADRFILKLYNVMI